MFDNPTSNHQTKLHIIKNNKSNEDEKENLRRDDRNILAKFETGISPLTPITYLNKIDKEASPIKSNIVFPNSTDYTKHDNFSLINSKYFNSTNLKENPFHKFNLDYYIKNFTSPRKNNNEETVSSKISFPKLPSCSTTNCKPRLTQSESRLISLQISKQKHLIPRLKQHICLSKLENDDISSSNKKFNKCDCNTQTDLQETFHICEDVKSEKSTPRLFNQSEVSVINNAISNGFNSPVKWREQSIPPKNHLLDNNINSIIPEAADCKKIENTPQDSQAKNKPSKDEMIGVCEYEKNLLISKEKKNDEVYKLLKVKNNLRKPEVSLSSSAKKITDMKKFDEDCQIDDGNKIF